MGKDLTIRKKNDNMLLLILIWWCIMIKLVLAFKGSDLFKVIGVIATFVTIFTFAWFKLILLDEYVHSFCLKERMKRGFECIYGYGVDEYFVLARLTFLTSILVLAFIILNGVDVVYGVFSSVSLMIESCISVVIVCTYGVQLSKYESAFGFSGVIVPFVSSCIGVLLTSMFVWHSGAFRILFLFFAYCFIICANEIRGATKTLECGDHAIVYVGDKLFDSKELQFYLIFYSKCNVEIWWMEKKGFKHKKVDEVKIIERLPQPSDGMKGVQDSTPVLVRAIKWIMGLRVFG